MAKKLVVEGRVLINYYQTAFITQATSEAAQFEAERTEDSLVQHLRTVSSGQFLQPTTLADGAQDALTRASLDAHIKKVQAEQINSVSHEQLQLLQATTSHDFLGRKVRIQVVDGSSQPVESVWFNPQTGYRISPNNRHVVQGKIVEIILHQNALVIQPTRLSRTLNSALTSYVIYVIDPRSMQPTITLEVI